MLQGLLGRYQRLYTCLQVRRSGSYLHISELTIIKKEIRIFRLQFKKLKIPYVKSFYWDKRHFLCFLGFWDFSCPEPFPLDVIKKKNGLYQKRYIFIEASSSIETTFSCLYNCSVCCYCSSCLAV